MKTKNLILLLIGMIGCIAPIQGRAQNPWNYQRTIRVTDSLVEVFEGDGMTILLESYTGAVKGTSLYANEPGVSPSNYGRTRFSVKNGKIFSIKMGDIAGFNQITYHSGDAQRIIHGDTITVLSAGSLFYDYNVYENGNLISYHVVLHLNHFGVTQWDGADLPSETILVVEEGSLYLAESEVIGVPEWINQGVWWKKKNPDGTNTTLFAKKKTCLLEELLNAALPSSQYGDQFTLVVMFDDGTSNGPQYNNSIEYFTVIDKRFVFVEEVLVTPSTATLTKGEQLQLTATVLPSHATHPALIWSSSDPEVATVNQTGLVTDLSPGNTTIRATAQDGSGCFGEAIIEVVAPSYQLIFGWGDSGILTALVEGAYLTSPAMLEEGTVVNFIAIPSSNYVSKEWRVNGVVVDTTSYELNIEIDRDYVVLVEFKLKVGMDDFKYQASTGYHQGMVSGKGLLQIYNLSGTLILEEQIHGAYLIPSMPEGIYVLRLGDWKKKVLLK